MDTNKVSTKNYRELLVWQEGIALAKAVYKLTEKFPRQETYALADQINRESFMLSSIACLLVNDQLTTTNYQLE